ncbi:MAG: hypothetical protein HC903_06710 [Methylacidiphilales bacterium]|nr:hypothetical protein [Candidatus Methylacidiphilales bacterium]NJR15984.1 hypothetical protein [Calothrix sp. CSU_2_0]
MANIKLNELSKLNLSGVELFDDSESFLTELNDENEQVNVVGGTCFFTVNFFKTAPKCLRGTLYICE